MSITFKDLLNFKVTAESKTLSEASEALGMAQPSLSLGIKKLEQELGVSLFMRTPQGIKLTPQGKSVLPDATLALELLEKMKGKTTVTSFKIGCHASVGMFVLGDFLKIMHKDNPSLDFKIIHQSSYEINKMVSQGEVDFGVVMNPLPIPGLITRPIGEDEVAVWESKNRYQDKLIFHPDMPQARSIISRWKGAPVGRTEVQDLELLTLLTHSGAGVGIIPSQVVKAQRWPLMKVPNTPTYKDHLALVCYPEMIKSETGKQIFQALKNSFKA